MVATGGDKGRSQPRRDPLIPEAETRRQIRANDATNRRYFGEVYAPRGFFPPEMCYSDRVLGPVEEAGYQWIILSGVACKVLSDR